MSSASAISFRGRSVPVFRAPARGALSLTTGLIAQAGFTHSLTLARNCIWGCSYCSVPTLRLYGGLKPADWQRWGRHTTFKENAAERLQRDLRPGQRIYCSSLVDPYQRAGEAERLMPDILEALLASPPAMFVVQTRASLVLRDAEPMLRQADLARFRVGFSLTTDREEVRCLYEPHCESVDARVRAMEALTEAGISVHCTLAPILPYDPERVRESLGASQSHCVPSKKLLH